MPSTPVRDISLYYEDHGRPDGEPLVLLHGFLRTGQAWRQHLPQLGERYRLIVPDWRGHGRTTNPRGIIVHGEVAEDIAAFVRAIGVGCAHFCGHSSGGMLLPFLALRHPDLTHTITMVGATYTFDEHVQAQARQRSANPSEKHVQALEAAHGPTHGPGYGRRLIQLWAESVLRPGELSLTVHDLRSVRCPTLIIHGDRDVFFPVHIPVTMYQAIPQAELCILPGCGHGPPHEKPALFALALLDFLARHPLTKP